MKLPKQLSLLIFFVGIALPAQVSFKAVPNKTSARVGEKIQLSYIITTSQDLDFEQITFPRFAGFQVVGRNVGQSYNYTNGKMTKQYMETVVLLPQREGTITVKGGNVTIDGKKYTSNEVTFQISKAVKNKNVSGGQLVFMEVNLTESKVYPNETLNAEVKLYAKSFDALRRRSDLEVPGMSDFQVIELTKNQERDFHQESINNQVYISEKIAVYQLQPTKSGQLEVPSFNIRVAIPMGFFEEKIIEVQSKPVVLKVKEFPPNAPSDFTGAVGDFSFVTYIDRKKAKVNKSVNYEIELVGEGNFSSIRLPKISLPKSLEVYSPKTRSSFLPTATGEKGKLVDSYVIVPQYGGEYVIPSINFSYFDKISEEYKTISTDEKILTVIGKSREDLMASAPKNLDSVSKEVDTLKKRNNILPEISTEITNIFDQKETTTEQEKISTDKKENSVKWYYYLSLLPVLGGLIWFIVRKKKKKVDTDEFENCFSTADYTTKLKEELYKLKVAEQRNDRSSFYHSANVLLNDMVCLIAKDQQHYDVIAARKMISDKRSDSFADRWENLYNQTQMMKYGVVNSDLELTEFYYAIEKMIKELLNN